MILDMVVFFYGRTSSTIDPTNYEYNVIKDRSGRFKIILKIPVFYVPFKKEWVDYQTKEIKTKNVKMVSYKLHTMFFDDSKEAYMHIQKLKDEKRNIQITSSAS